MGGGAGYAATLNVKLTAPYDYATAYTKASHDCWLVFEFAFSGPELPMASVQEVVLTEQTSDHDPVQTLTPAQVQWTPYPPPPPNPMRFQYALGPGMHNGAWHVDFKYTTGISMILQDGDADIEVENLTITSAVDAVDGHYGFCLYDPTDEQRDEAIVDITLADYLIPGYDNQTTVTVTWSDPFTGQAVCEQTRQVAMVTSPYVLRFTWDGTIGGSSLKQPAGPYPYSVSASQPIRTYQPSPVAYDWQSHSVYPLWASAAWPDALHPEHVRVSWNIKDEGGQGLVALDVLAVDPAWSVHPHSVTPPASGPGSIEIDCGSASNYGRWFFLVRPKYNSHATDRAHLNHYGNCDVAHCAGRGVNHNLIPDPGEEVCNRSAAGEEVQGLRPDPSFMYSMTGMYPDTIIAELQNCDVFVVMSHGVGGGRFQVGYAWCVGENDATAEEDPTPAHMLTRGLAGFAFPKLRLALLLSCGSVQNTDPFGNLGQCIYDNGAQCVVGWYKEVPIYGAQYFAGLFWNAVGNGYSAADSAEWAASGARQYCEVNYPDAEGWKWWTDNLRVLGDVVL